MMKTYRSLSVFLIAVILVGLCACGSKEGNAKGNGYKKEVILIHIRKMTQRSVLRLPRS